MPRRRPEPTAEPGATGWSPRDVLVPYLLLAVSLQRAHGYLLEEYLRSLGFVGLDMSTLYRRLRQLEKEGPLRFEWEPGPAGPARRGAARRAGSYRGSRHSAMRCVSALTCTSWPSRRTPRTTTRLPMMTDLAAGLGGARRTAAPRPGQDGPGPDQSNGICLLDVPTKSNVKPSASARCAVPFPHVATCPGPTSLPGGLSSCTRCPGGGGGPANASALARILPR